MNFDTDGGGPAMRALTDRRRAFVLALLMQTKRNAAAAAREAGYSDVKEGAKVRAFWLMRDEGVLAALHEEAGRRLQTSAFMAADVLVGIAEDKRAPLKERRAAAVALLDRTGFGASQNINVNKTVTDRTGTAMAARIEAFAVRLGLDPATLLGVNAPVETRLIDVTPAKE